MNIENFTSKYLQKLTNSLALIDKSVVAQMVGALDNSIKQNAKIYIIGNGGSAATASHMANDLGGGLKRRNIRNFNVVSLADNVPMCTALANDIGYENIFYAQIKNIINPEDILIAISCSGNSPNIVKAVEYAKTQKATVIGITGFDGGKLKTLSDINFHVATEKNEYGIVEDIHMILNHVIYSHYAQLEAQ